jgi:hypothetical protein
MMLQNQILAAFQNYHMDDGSYRLLDALISTFDKGQTEGPRGEVVLNADLDRVTRMIAKFDEREENKKRMAESTSAAAAVNDHGPTGTKGMDIDMDGGEGEHERREAKKAQEAKAREAEARETKAREEREEKAREEKAKAEKEREEKAKADKEREEKAKEAERAKVKEAERKKAEADVKKLRREELKKAKEAADAAKKKDAEAKKKEAEARKLKEAEARKSKEAEARNLKEAEAKRLREEATRKTKEKEGKELKEAETSRVEEGQEKEAGKRSTRSKTNTTPGRGPPSSKPPKPLVHKDGGRITATRPKPKSASVVPTTDDEEIVVVDSKGKRKADDPDHAKGGKRKKLKEVINVDEEEEDDDDDDDDSTGNEEEYQGDDDDHPLLKAQRRSALKKESKEPKKLPKNPPIEWFPVQERCALCARLKVDCFWADGAPGKEGPKCCYKCRQRKTVCINGFATQADKVKVDLSTPLGDLIERLAPPPSDDPDVPRSGVAGENANGPTTLGDLLVDILVALRQTKEENVELKKEVKGLQRTVETMATYDSATHREVMANLEGLPAEIVRRSRNSISPRPRRSTTPRPEPSLVKPAVAPSPANEAAVEKTSLLQSRLHMYNSDEEDSSPLPDGGKPASSASQTNDNQESNVPSVVADRTRNKKKVAQSVDVPAVDPVDIEVDDDVPVQLARPNKRKMSADGDEEVEEVDNNKKARGATRNTKPAARKR